MGTALARVTSGLSMGLAYVVVLCDETLTIDWISPSITEALGWLPDEVIGRNALTLIHPDDIEMAARLLDSEVRSPHPYGVDPARRSINQVRVLDPRGGWRAFDYAANNQTTNPDVEGFVFVLHDTTERRLLDDVFTSLMTGLPVAETAQRVAELLSFQCEGARVRVVLADRSEARAGMADPSAIEKVLDIDEAGASIAVEHHVGVPPTEWCMVLVERAAALVRVAVTRRLGEQALRRRLDEKTALISAVSHDLRSPIAAIQLMSSLLDDRSESLSPDQRRELAKRINADAGRTSRLLADLTSLDRLLHGSSDLALQRVSMRPLLERVLEGLDATDHVVSLIADDSCPAARADPVLTERIVDNLVTNALKHTPHGSRVEVTVVTSSEHELTVHVDDDGPGVQASIRATMFDAYVRGDDSSVRPGSGMGLFLVRTFAEVQGGRAMCDASPLGGARFSVVLPRWQERVS